MSHTPVKHNNYPCLYIYILGKERAAREPISYPSFQNKNFESRWPIKASWISCGRQLAT